MKVMTPQEKGRIEARYLAADRIGDLSIPIRGAASCTGRPLPEARAAAERVLAFVGGRAPATARSPRGSGVGPDPGPEANVGRTTGAGD
jgi:sugar/nucleoside kinase (ribokinase family)